MTQLQLEKQIARVEDAINGATLLLDTGEELYRAAEALHHLLLSLGLLEERRRRAWQAEKELGR